MNFYFVERFPVPCTEPNDPRFIDRLLEGEQFFLVLLVSWLFSFGTLKIDIFLLYYKEINVKYTDERIYRFDN